MVKHFKAILAIFSLLFILLIIMPGSFANENQTDSFNLESDVTEATPLANDDNLASGRIDIYFDASAAKDGDGSKENPYREIDSSRLRNNSNIYLEEGEYRTYLDMEILENCSIYGKNPEKTVIISYYFNKTPNIIANGNFKVSNVTFSGTHFEARDEFTATNTIFNTYSTFYYSQGIIRSLSDNSVNMNLVNCTFDRCFGNYGGAIYVVRGNVTIRNSRFKDNFANGYGGAIWISNATARITDSTFEGNHAEYDGGAIYYITSDLSFDNSTFVNNHAELGGAIYSYGSKLPLTNCTFEKNSASSSGGAIYSHESDVKIIGSDFKSNSANSCGGSVYAYGLSEVEINDTSFDKEYSSGIGAAIFGETSSIKMNNVNITNCFSNFGSGLTVLFGDSSLNNVIAKNNTAKYNGGVIYQAYGDLSANGCQFMDNSALNGGAIYLNSVTISDFNSNQFTNNDAVNGFDIYLMSVNNAGINQDSINVFSVDSPDIFVGNGDYVLLKVNDTFNGTLPSRYSSAENGYVTPVKDQAYGGYCWAFTAMGVLESCVVKASGIQYVFSENNLVNLNKMYSDYGLISNEEAGSTLNALGYLLSWLGPVNGTSDPYDIHSKLSPIINGPIHVQNVLFLDINETNNITQIKDAVIRYGAVGTALYWDDASCNGPSYYFSHGHEIEQDHAITIVGWDDNYSRYNFNEIPPADGAWIVKNSWGNESGDEGYFYISYYSQSMHFEGSRIQGSPIMDRLYTFIFNDTIRLDKNYQYDFAGPTAFMFFDNGTTIKNVFRATEKEYLASVSTYFLQETAYDINIYVNGKLVLNQTSVTGQGYYTINLDKIIPLEANDTFEVAFKMKNLNDDSFMALFSEASQQTKKSHDREVSFVSFEQNPNVWYELGDMDVFSIKAFTILKEINTALNLTIEYNGSAPVNITAHVVDEYQRKLAYGNVTFNMEGQDYVLSVFDGAAKITHAFENPVIAVTATFNAVGYNQSTCFREIDRSVEKVDLDLAVSTYLNTAKVNISASQNINESVEVIVNNKPYIVNLTDGKYCMELDDLENGEYEIKASIYNSTLFIGKASDKFNISAVQSQIISSDFTTFENSNETYSIRLVDQMNSPLSGKTIKFNINGRDTEVSTGSDGLASLPIDLAGGSYKVITIFEGDEIHFPINQTNFVKVKTCLQGEINIQKSNRSAEISVGLSRDVNVDLIISVNGANHTVNSRDTLKLVGLANGNYNVAVYLNDENYKFETAFAKFNINITETRLVGSDVSAYEDNAVYSVRLIGDDRNIANMNIKYVLDNNSYDANTGEDGVVSIPISLPAGDYRIDVYFDGFKNYMASNTTNNIKIIKTIILPSNTVYTYGSQYCVKLYDMQGNPLKNTQVSFVVDGSTKKVTTDSSGNAKVQIELRSGSRTIKVTNPKTGEVKTQKINVKPRLCENKDITTYYDAGNTYKVKVLDDNGNAAKKVKVSIKIGSTTKTVTTDSKGYASLKITQKPGTYTITTTYKGYKISNKLTVKTTIVTKDLTVKKGKTIQFTAKLLNSKGKIIKGKLVNVKFNGKTYKIRTNSKGIATLKVSSKNLKITKYTVKSSYGSLTVSNKITIKR